MMEEISFNYLGIEPSGDELKPNGNKKMQIQYIIHVHVL